MRRSTKRALIIAGATACLGVIGTGAGLATADPADSPIPSSARQQAEAAALAHVGEGTVSDHEASDEEGSYEVEVLKADGVQVEVQLDENFAVVTTEEEQAADDTD
jgi:hypothetical protein